MIGIGEDEEVVPVKVNGGVEFMPLDRTETPTWLIVFKDAENLTTTDPNGDRVAVGAMSLDEAIGQVLRENPLLRYEDILDHMEV
jgi:hypothetical protein